MNSAPDFTDTELATIQQTLAERFGQAIELQLGDAEVRLTPADRELTLCPTVYWKAGKAGFVVVKTASNQYRSQFFYRVHQQFGTGINEFDNIGDCVITLLQVQAEHEANHPQL